MSTAPRGLDVVKLEADVTAALAGRCAVGIDLVDIDEVERSIATLGDAYVERLFTDHERASCTGTARSVAASLAARFAAKEATIKVLAPTDGQPEWRSIEVVRLPHGACELQLHETAADLARRAGLSGFSVSLTHDGNLAAAVVVAERVTMSDAMTRTGDRDEHNGSAGRGELDAQEDRVPDAPFRGDR
jgi:holo-[acyl-carrier protein] synthase